MGAALACLHGDVSACRVVANVLPGPGPVVDGKGPLSFPASHECEDGNAQVLRVA